MFVYVHQKGVFELKRICKELDDYYEELYISDLNIKIVNRKDDYYVSGAHKKKG